jgi:uncharacterized RDD family membrane protein YckC
LARQLEVVTPENVPITFEMAGIGSRFGAMLVDLLIQVVVYIAGLIGGVILAQFFEFFQAGNVVLALMIIGGFLLVFGYFIFFETLWNGQTPGKRAFHLRVIRDGGYPITFAAAATRNLVRIADFLPVSYAAGALSTFFHPQYKRLGDMAAGTVVVKERELGNVWQLGIRAPKSVGGQGTPKLPETVNDPVQVLDPQEIAVLRRFALRRWEMTADDAERVAYRLIVPMVGRLNLTFLPGVAPRYADLVTVMVADIDTKIGQDELF